MKIFLIHLSDIHIKSEDNYVEHLIGQITPVFRNEISEINKVFIVITGDIAYSGKAEEYKNAKTIFDSLSSDIEHYSGNKPAFIIVPGNHDCDFENTNRTVRDTIIKSIQQNDVKVDEGIINQCCEVQKNFFDFLNSFSVDGKVVYSDKLFRVIKYTVENYTVNFYCYNTAWVSQIDEQPGKMYFPINRFLNKFNSLVSDVAVNVLHQPPNWLNPTNRRDLINHLEKTSNLTLTGHEHIPSVRRVDDFQGNYTDYIEGDVLQAISGNKVSGFNKIIIDLKDKKQRIDCYQWDGEIYSLNKETSLKDWVSCSNIQDGVSKFRLDKKFEGYLNDPGASYIHPKKPNLTLEDIFVYPDLRDLKIEKTKDEKILNDVENSKILFGDRKSTRLNSSHIPLSRMPSSA